MKNVLVQIFIFMRIFVVIAQCIFAGIIFELFNIDGRLWNVMRVIGHADKFQKHASHMHVRMTSSWKNSKISMFILIDQFIFNDPINRCAVSMGEIKDSWKMVSLDQFRALIFDNIVL